MVDPRLTPVNLMAVRGRWLEKLIDLIKGADGKISSDFGICGIQDLKVQLIDCANAMAEYQISGATPVSIVGKTRLALSPSRLLSDRKLPMLVGEFNQLMSQKGLLDMTTHTLTEGGTAYGKMSLTPGQPSGTLRPYYYDDKFDDLLRLLGVPAQPKVITKKR